MAHSPIFPFSKKRKMRVAVFISGSGTNGIKIIEQSNLPDSNYEVTLIFSDVKDSRMRRSGSKMSRAKDIAQKYGIFYEFLDIRDFYKDRGVKRTDLSIRPQYDQLVLQKIRKHSFDLIANAGYMSIMTPVILNEYEGKIVNVHPADLRINENEKRKYVGIHVVEEAILAGEKEIRSTTHIVREEVDYGEILLISAPVIIGKDVSLPELRKNKALRKEKVSKYQSLLKKKGDWVIFPLTIKMISQGRFSLGQKGIYLDGKHLPKGFKVG
jgi:folate-dependent phosphoribosylglycinamide formyltransferase PurN